MSSTRRPLTIQLAVLAFILLFGLTSSAALAQDWKGRARIQGTVLNENDEPIAGATVTLTLSGRGPAPIQTNKKGKWSYLGLTGGPWSVVIEAPGYAVSEGSVPISQAVPNEPINKKLKPAGSVAAAVGSVDPAAAAAAAAAQAASEALSRAGQLLESGQRAEGRAVLEEIVGTLDANRQGSIFMAIAQTYLEEEDTTNAISTMERALAVDPQHVDTLSKLSSILINEGRAEEAQQYIDRMPAGAKIDHNALLNQGIAKYNNGDTDAALVDFQKIVADYPEVPEAYYYRGLCYLAQGKTDEAKADFTKLIEMAPEHPKAAEAKDFLQYL